MSQRTDLLTLGRIGFLVLYLICLIPTYVLPWLTGAAQLGGMVGELAQQGKGSQLFSIATVLFIVHVAFSAATVFIAYIRANANRDKYLVALVVVAAVFDVVPFLNWIPLVPTVLHIVALVRGFGGDDATAV